MSIRVFHESTRVEPGTQLGLDASESHYLVRVRRARAGERIEVLDGSAVHEAKVLVAEPNAALVEVLSRLPEPPVPPLWLGLGTPEPKATLEAITLASEIGVDRITLLRCEHSHHAAPSEARMERVMRAAQRQCGRPRPPTIEGPEPLAQWVAREDPRPSFVAWTELRGGASTFCGDQAAGARLLVGPEAGLTPAEAAAAVDAGFVAVSLGPWVLRSPTAVVAGLSRLLVGEKRPS